MADSTVDLWALDEVHFQQHGSRCRMWVPPETRDPVLRHHPTRHSAGYFGAVRLRDGSFQFRRETDQFNGLTFFEFMKELYATSILGGRRVVVITDNAKYHHARLHRQWREQHAAQFVLDYLPPYSPELNPIERVWKLTRRLCLHNRYFPLLQEVTNTVEAEFAGWASPNETFTVSWVVPTAFAVLALNQIPCSCGGLEQVTYRVNRGIEMLIDRACPGGGWNAGNGVVYGTAVAPHPDDTAIALLALSDRGQHPTVQNGVQYLERLAPTLAAPWSLSWAILALASHQRPIASFHRSLVALPDLASIEDTSTIALICLALDYGRTLSALGVGQ